MPPDVDESRSVSRPDRTTTHPDDLGLEAAHRSYWLRLAGVVLLAAFIVAGAFGVMGVRSRTVSVTGTDGTRVTLTYAAVTRPGLATPWEIVIERPGGFDSPLTVRTSTDYLAAFDENGLAPDPGSATTDDDETVWEFEPPDGETMVVGFDARWEPGVQWRRAGTTTVEVDGQTIAVSYTTWVWP
jgi:hypothetical protein